MERYENSYFTEMCSGSEAGSYLRLIDFVYHSTLDLIVIKKKRYSDLEAELAVVEDSVLARGRST